MDLKSKAFKDLQRKWYSKLKKKGFEDIESVKETRDTDTNQFIPVEFLKSWSSRIARLDPLYVESTTEYYRAAGQFLYEHNFRTKSDRLVWQLHSEGLSYREIAKELKVHRIRTNKDSVRAVINNLAKVMMAKKA